MQIKVKKGVLFNVLKNALNETPSRSDLFNGGSSFLGDFAASEDDKPIIAAPHMSIQLSTEQPPVEDPEYVPGSISELCTASTRIMEEVPIRQVEFVYRFLHKILDLALDKEDEETQEFINEEKYIISEMNDMKSMLLKRAVSRLEAGEDSYDIADEYVGSYDEFEGTDPGDLASKIELMASGLDDEHEKPQQPVQGQSSPKTIRRKGNVSTALETGATSEEDVSSMPEFQEAQNKELFLKGFNDGADAAVGIDVQEPQEKTPDYELGFDAGYRAHDEQSPSQDTKVSKEEVTDEDFFNLQDLDPELLATVGESEWHPFYRLLPALYKAIVEISFEAEREGFQMLHTGLEERDVQDRIVAKYGINYANNFVPANLRKPSFTAEKKKASISNLLQKFRNGMIQRESVERFNRLFDSALEESGMKERAAQDFMSHALSINLEENRKDYDFMPYDERMKNVIQINFAELTVFRPGQKMRGESKPYQQSTSTNFRRKVKEDETEQIVDDFLDKLTKKYMKDGVYKVKSGRELFEYEPVEFGKVAEEYARKEIEDALKAQQAGSIEIDEYDLDDDDLADQVDMQQPEVEMTEEEIAEKIGIKLKNAKDFETLAPFFGFSGSSGLRQWYLKFAERQFRMLALSLRSGGEGFENMHKQTMNVLLANKFEGKDFLTKAEGGNFIDALKDMQTKYSNPKQGTVEEVYNHILQKAIPQIESQKEVDVSSENYDSSFFNTLGGQLVRSISGTVFKKILTEIDKSWTEVVAAEVDARVPGVTEKQALGLAEYWTGKKEEPDYENMTKAAKNLMKHEIGPEIYAKIKQESEDWFEDAVLFEFGKEGTAVGEYRKFIIGKLASMLENKKEIEKEVIKAMNDIHEESSHRQAMSNLADYEVDDGDE